MQLSNKVVLISGGASGLGEATARQFHQQGAKLVLCDLNEQNGQQLANELDALFVKTNVCEEADVIKAHELAVQRWGQLDGLVNCAGVGTPGKLVDKEGAPLSLAGFQKVIDINLVGSFNMARIFAAQRIKLGLKTDEENGVIIHTASVAAFDGQIGQIAYSASKAAVVGMTLPMARELAKSGIRVMCIAPGIFETPMLMGLPEKARLSLGQQVPFPSRLGKPQEYAQLAQHIFENKMLNGECIRLDGAIRMAPK